jgi:hypothetical protein
VMLLVLMLPAVMMILSLADSDSDSFQQACMVVVVFGYYFLPCLEDEEEASLEICQILETFLF